MSQRGGGGMSFRGYRGRGGRGGVGGGAGDRGGGAPRGSGRGGFRGRGGHTGGVPQSLVEEPCKNFVKTGECQYGDNCRYLHNLRLQREFTSGQRDVAVRAVALYEAQGMIVYSEGSKVKFLNDLLSPVTELALDGTVTALLIVGHFLFVAYDAVLPGITALPVGLLKAFFLATTPPTELVLTAPGQPWAHRSDITALDAAVLTEDPTVPPVLFSASLDCVIRMWQFNPTHKGWDSRALEGHVRGVTSLVWVSSVGRLYSGSVDRTIKVWNPADGSCTCTILPPAPSVAAHRGGGFADAVAQSVVGKAAVSGAPLPGVGASVGGVEPGHNADVLALAEMGYSGLTFLVSGAVDGSIKVWRLSGSADAPALIKDHVVEAAESGGAGHSRLLCLAVLDLEAAPGNPILIVGHQDGSIVMRDVATGIRKPAAVLHANRNAGHQADVRTVVPGPSGYFFSGGNDDKLCVWEALVPATGTDAGVPIAGVAQ